MQLNHLNIDTVDLAIRLLKEGSDRWSCHALEHAGASTELLELYKEFNKRPTKSKDRKYKMPRWWGASYDPLRNYEPARIKALESFRKAIAEDKKWE